MEWENVDNLCNLSNISSIVYSSNSNIITSNRYEKLIINDVSDFDKEFEIANVIIESKKSQPVNNKERQVINKESQPVNTISIHRGDICTNDFPENDSIECRKSNLVPGNSTYSNKLNVAGI